MQNMKAASLRIKSYGQCLGFSKVGQRSRSRSYVQNLWYCRKGLVIRNTNAKYGSPISYGKYTRAPQTVHNTPVMNILKGYFYIILF